MHPLPSKIGQAGLKEVGRFNATITVTTNAPELVRGGSMVEPEDWTVLDSLAKVADICPIIKTKEALKEEQEREEMNMDPEEVYLKKMEEQNRR